MNRKKIAGITALLAVALITAFHVKMITFEGRLTDVSLDNIEALAQDESGMPPNCIQVKGFCLTNNIQYNHLAFE